MALVGTVKKEVSLEMLTDEEGELIKKSAK